ncbi:hypothetical protein D9615_002976 [Tricholomella constricta]|uniref:Uncharacterized protein n=1 Tax=Tricholomella constricta TaxID=117010 RepID=A0A8H5M6C9_9AGAR|nr:hypothetical protein D9615_002976 [Tricholomella constricta]
MSASFPTRLSLDELEDTLGVLFVGYVVSMIAYGFTLFQAYVYHLLYTKDDWRIKATVTVVCVLDTATSALISHSVYYYIIPFFPLTPGVVDATITFCLENIFSVVVVYIVQLYYVIRIWKVCNNLILPGIIGFISTISFGLGLTMSVKLFQNLKFANLAVSSNKVVVSSSHALTFLAAFTTSCTLCFYLHPTRNSGVKPSEGWFDALSTFSLARGTLAAIVQLGYFIAVRFLPSHQSNSRFDNNEVRYDAGKAHLDAFSAHGKQALNSRDVYEGQGIDEEDFSRVDHSYEPSSSSASRNTGVRFDAMDSRGTINIEVPTRNIMSEESGKVNLHDASMNWDGGHDNRVCRSLRFVLSKQFIDEVSAARAPRYNVVRDLREIAQGYVANRGQQP